MSNSNKIEVNKNYLNNVCSSVTNKNLYISTSSQSSSLGYNKYYNEYYNVDTGIASTFSCKDIILNVDINIKDVEIIVPNKVIKVIFNDDKFEKAICHEDDEFDLEIGIMICIAKHLLGSGSRFNKILAKGIKIVDNKIKAKAEAKKEQARIEAKRLKNHIKKLENRKRKESEMRASRIQEMAEAINLAHKMENNRIDIKHVKGE